MIRGGPAGLEEGRGTALAVAIRPQTRTDGFVVPDGGGQLTASSRTAPPRVLWWTSLAVCIAGAVMVLLGAWQVGISTDEPAHVVRYENLVQHGWYLLDDDFDGDQPGAWVTDRYVYGPVFTDVLHGVNRAVGLDPPGELGTSLDAYVARHLMVALCGLLGTFAVAAIGRRLFGSWSWGMVAAATVMAIPMWPGLSMFDIKDVPAATGYTLLTWGLVELLHVHDWTRRTVALSVVPFTTGLMLAVGTRPGLWAGCIVSIGVAAVFAALQPQRTATWRRGALSVALLGVAAAYVVLWLAYPAFFGDPRHWLPGSATGSADYAAVPGGNYDTSWGYLPGRVVFVMPPALLLIGAIGCLTAIPRRLPRPGPVVGTVLLVGLQALLLPILAVVRESLLYDDLRQVLFACPAVALLLTAGWRRFVTEMGQDSRYVRRALDLAWVGALIVPLAVQAQLFPFAYSYAAPQAPSLGAEIQNDYWRVSLRELQPRLPLDEFLVCSPLRSPSGASRRFRASTIRPVAEGGSDCRSDQLNTVAPLYPLEVDPRGPRVEKTFVALFNRGQEPGWNCSAIGTVERWRYLSPVVMSTAARCRLVLAAFPRSGLSLQSQDAQTQYLLDGWTSRPDDDGVRLADKFGALGFELPQRWTDESLVLDLQGSAAEVPEVYVNNVLLLATETTDGWQVQVPASVASAMGERRLAIAVVQPPTGEPLFLSGVTVRPS
jgi:hypothetical protein